MLFHGRMTPSTLDSRRGIDGVEAPGELSQGGVAQLNRVVVGPLRIQKIEKGRAAATIGAVRYLPHVGCLCEHGLLDAA